MEDQTSAQQAVVSPVNVQEFSKKIKEKYPEYKDVDDLTLAQKIVEKYPEYKDRVSFDQPKPEATAIQPVVQGKDKIPQPIQEPVKPLGRVDQLKVDYLRKTRGEEYANQEQVKMQTPNPVIPGWDEKSPLDKFTTGVKSGWEGTKGGLKYTGAVMLEGIDKMDGEDDLQYDNRLFESAKENFKAAPRGEGIWYQLGSFTPQMIGIAAAAASAPLTGGTSLSAAPAIIGGSNIATLVASASGSAMHDYDQYNEQEGKEGSDLARIGVGIGSGAAEYLAERIGLDRYMPKGSMSKAFTKFLSTSGSEVAEEIGKNALSKNPSLKGFLKKTALNMGEEGSEESLTESGIMLIETLYKDDKDEAGLGEVVTRLKDAFGGGALMGGVLSPITYGADAAYQKKMQQPITTAIIEGQQFTVNNPEDLGIEGKPIFAKDAEGNIKAVPNFKATDPITQTQGEIDQAQQAATDQQALMNGILDPNAQILNEVNEDGVRLVKFSNGQSKIITSEGEVIANDQNEEDRILEAVINGQPLPQPKVSEAGEIIEPAPERKVITQTIGNTSIDIIEGEEFDEVIPSEKVPLEKAYAALEKKFKDNKKFKVVADKVQVEEPGETKYDDPIKKTVIKSIKIVPVEVLERQKAEADLKAKEQKQADTNILLEFIDEFNATPQSREDKQQASDIEAIAKKLGYQTERNAMNQIRLFDNSGTIEKPKTQSNDNTNSNSRNNVQVSNEGTSSMGRSGLGSDAQGEKQNLVKLNVNNLGQESENVSNNLEAPIENQIVENVNAENSLQKEKLQNEESEKSLPNIEGKSITNQGENTPQAQQGQRVSEGLEENVKTISDFSEVKNKKAFDYLRQKSFGIEVGRSHTGEFVGKDGERYYIRKDVNKDNFAVYDAKEVDNVLDKQSGTILPIGFATFDTTPMQSGKGNYFTGYENNNSIEVDEKYRRKGLATAITRFAEGLYKIPYKPTNVLSEEMKGFVGTYKSISTGQPATVSKTADPVAEQIVDTSTNNVDSSVKNVDTYVAEPLTEEQRITANNKVVDLVNEYNSIPNNHTNKKRIAFQAIQAGVQRLGYTVAENGGKLEIQSNGKKIQKIGTKQTTEDIQAHKALTDYPEEVQSFIQRFIDNPTELFGLDLHSTTKQAQQGIKNIQEGKKTVAANEVLDSFEKMFNDGVIRIKGSGVNGYYEIPIDEYLSAINEQLAVIDVEKELDSPSQVDEWLNENKNDQDLEPIDIEEFENDLENYTNGKENINPEEEAGIGTPESSNESPKPIEEEISGEAKAGIVQQSLFPVAEFPIDKLTKEEKRIKEKLDSLTPTQLKEAKKGIESIDKQINEKLSAIKASKKTIKDARKQARDEYAKDNSGKLITDNVVNSMPLIRRHTNQQGLLQREYLKLIADKEKLIDNIISGARAQNEINWDAPVIPEEKPEVESKIKVGDIVKYTEPAIVYVKGVPTTVQANRAGTVKVIKTNGDLELRTQNGDIITIKPSDIVIPDVSNESDQVQDVAGQDSGQRPAVKKPLSEFLSDSKKEVQEKKQAIQVKLFKHGEGGTKGLFEDSKGNLYKSLIQTWTSFKDGELVKNEATKDSPEYEILKALQGNPNIPVIGNRVETSEGAAFEIERLEDIDKLTLAEFFEIEKILDNINGQGFFVNDIVTVMRRPKTGELVIVDFSGGLNDKALIGNSSYSDNGFTSRLFEMLSPEDKTEGSRIRKEKHEQFLEKLLGKKPEGYEPIELNTPNAKLSLVQGGGLNSFQIITSKDDNIMGYVRGADFPGERGSDNKRGEIFILGVQSGKNKGTGTKLMLDALRLIKSNGSDRVKFTQPSKEGKLFNESLIAKGYIELIRTHEGGTQEYKITDKVLGEVEKQSTPLPEEKPQRFEIGKKLTDEEKREVYKTLKDAYKENNRPSTFEDVNGFEKRVWLGNASDYMNKSDITGAKIRWFIDLPGNKIAHPSELYGNLPMSDIEKAVSNIEYYEGQGKRRYDKTVSAIEKKGQTKVIADAIQTALDNGAKFMKQFGSSDQGERDPYVYLQFDHGDLGKANTSIPAYVININDEYLGFTDADLRQEKPDALLRFDQADIDWERFYNEQKAATPDSQENSALRGSLLPEEKQAEEDIRFRAVPNNGSLVALHNISEENIQSVKDRRGKLITPSLAIVQKGVPFTDFGTITLIGTKEMIDPQSGTKVFKGDVYSPTVPRAQYEVDKRTYDRWSSSIMNRAYSPAFREIASKVANVIEDFGSFRKELARSSAESVKNQMEKDMRIVYILEKGIDFKVPMKPKPFYIANNYEAKLTPEELSRAKEFLQKFRKETEATSLDLTKETEQSGYDLVRDVVYRTTLEQYKHWDNEAERTKLAYERAENAVDRTNLNFLSDRIGALSSGKQEFDSDKYNELKDKLFKKKAIQDDYSQWLDEKINQFQGRKYFEKGNEKLTYSTENLVEATTGHTRAKEKGMTYGMNKAKASAIKQLKNIEEIRKAQKDLVTKEEMTRIEKELQEEYFQVADKIKYKWSNGFSKLDDFGKSLADYFKGYGANQALHRNDFVPSSYDVEDFKEFADRLKSSPIDYLEAKTQRVVDLSEFKYAVVPESTSKETIKTLKDAGIKVRKYGEYEQRTEIIKEIADKDNAIRFQIIGEKGAANITGLVDNLTVAKQMTEAGKDAKTIFLTTGWEKFPDGWKYDQKTDQLPLKKDALKELSDNQKLANGLHVFSTMDYRKNADGSYDFSMMKKGATSTSEFVQYRNIPDRDLEYWFDNNTELINKIRNGEGSEGLIGDMEEAKEIRMDFEHYVSGGMPLNQLVDNKQLFKAYPELAKVVVVYDPNSKPVGSFGKDLDGQSIITTKYVSGPVAKSTIYHEIQHAIQDIEGFAKGGNMETAPEKTKSLYKQYALKGKVEAIKFVAANIDENIQRIKQLASDKFDFMYQVGNVEDVLRDMRDGKVSKEDIQNIYDFIQGNNYTRLAGEVEARNVQTRLGMNPQDRYDQLVSETQDVAEDQKIYIQDAIRKAYSIENNSQESTESKNLNVSPTASTDLKSRPNVVNALTKISDELGEPVYIINSSEIPEKVGELKKQITKGNRVPAFFYNGKIYLLSDQVTSVSDALKSYLHELIVHKGLREVFAGADKASIIGKQYAKFNDLMVDVFGSMSRSQKIAIASYYVPDLYNQNGKIMRNPTMEEKALIGEEFLAHVSENQEIYDEPTLSRWQQFINRLWQIVRKAFRLTSNQFSQKDLTDIVRESRERLKNKAKGETEAETRLRVTDEKKSNVSLGEKPMSWKDQVEQARQKQTEATLIKTIKKDVGLSNSDAKKYLDALLSHTGADGKTNIGNPSIYLLKLREAAAIISNIEGSRTITPELTSGKDVESTLKLLQKNLDNSKGELNDVYGARFDLLTDFGKDIQKIIDDKTNTANTILINGVSRSTLNSNSKPIANSEEGIRNFYKWFGDSKVVDSEGRPLVVYHGSPLGGITEFDRSKSATQSSGLKEYGLYFGTNKKLAEKYANERELSKSAKDEIKNRIADLYEKQMEVRNNRDYNEIEQAIQELKSKLSGEVYSVYLKIPKLYSFDANGQDGAYGWASLKVPAGYKTAFGVDAIEVLNGNNKAAYGTEKVDGILAKNISDIHAYGSDTEKVKELSGDVYLLFDGNSNNIKSATGNNGSFSPEDNNIRFRVEQAVEDLNKINSLPKSNLSDLLKSVNETVEASMAEAHGIKATPLWERIKAKLIEIKESTQHFQHITEAEFPLVYDKLRQFEAIPDRVKKEAYERISEVIRPIAKNQQHFEAFERYIVLQDLVNDIENTELFANKELPWGYDTVDEIKTDMRNVRTYVMRNPAVLKAVRDRQAMMKEVKQALVDNKLLKDNGNDKYFHHQVLAYMEGQVFPGVSSKDVRNHKKGWQRSRQGSIAAYNTNYLESEFEVLAQSLEQVAIKNILGELGAKTNIMPDLIKQAKQMGGSWRDYIPEGYKQWFPKQGTNAYKAASMAEKAVQNILNDPNSPDVAQFIAEVEGNMWVIPEPVAKQLDSMKDPEKEMIFPAALRVLTGKWKQWILLNPYSAIKYNFNNMSGDIDIVMAYDPTILKPKYAKTATTEAWNNLRGKGMSEDMKEALKYGIITSGLSIQEIPDVNQQTLFRSVTKGSGNIAQKLWGKTGGKYWGSVTDMSQFRENVLRLASYKFFKEQIEAGKKPLGASDRKAVDALYRADTNPKEIAGKLARELMGDYGNLSQAGQWFRSHSYPFWSWVEINSPRYYRLLKNTKFEDNTGTLGRVAAVGAKKTALNVGKLGVKTMLLMGLVVLWNRAMFPDEDDELSKMKDQKLKLIIGRREDGSIMTMKVQGAFSDVLSFFSLEDVVSDVESEKTAGKMAKEGGTAFVNKFAQGAMPLTKTGAEMITKKSFYPDILNPRPVRDRAEQGLRIFKMDKIYNYLTHKPSRPFGKEVTGLLVYDNSPGEAAYYTIRQNIFDFMKDNGEEFPSGEPTQRSNALYYYKQSLKFGDTEKASFWFEKYKELGGTIKGYNASMKKGMIINTIPNDLKAAWIQSLDDEDKEVLDMANKWYFETYLKVGIPKKGIE